MTDANDIRQPMDHLPKKEDRDPSMEVDEPHYPGTGSPEGDAAASPDTAAESDKADRHGVAKLPPTGR